MKRIIIFALAAVLALGVAVFATDEAQIYFGVEANPIAGVYPAVLGLSFGVDNIQSSVLSITGDLYTIRDNLIAYPPPMIWGAELGFTLDFGWLEVIPFDLGVIGGVENSLDPAHYPDYLEINSWEASVRFFGDIADGLLVLYWENVYAFTNAHGGSYNMGTVFGVEGEIPLW